MPVAERSVEQRRGVGELSASPQATADQQLLGVRREAQNRSQPRQRGTPGRPAYGLWVVGAELLYPRSPHVAGTALDDVFFASPAAAARGRAARPATIGWRPAEATTAEATATPATAAEGEDGGAVEVDPQLVAVAVGDRAGAIRPLHPEDTSPGPEVGRLSDRDSLRHAEMGRQRRRVADRHEQASGLDEVLEVEHALELEAAAHVIR